MSEYNNFVFYKEWLDQLKVIAAGGTPEDMVSLCDGLKSFLSGEEPENVTPMAQLMLNQMTMQITRDKEHLEEVSQKRSQNRIGKTKDNKQEQTITNDNKTEQTITKQVVEEEVEEEVEEQENNTLSVTERDLKSEFEIVWSKYPRKVGRKDAYRHYKSARKKGTTFDEVYNGVLKYAEAMQGQDDQYIAHGSAWFNGHRWEDDVSPHKPRPHKPTMAELHQLPIIDPFAELRGAT